MFRIVFGKIYNDLHSFVQVKLKAKMMVREAFYIRQCYDVLQGILDSEEENRKPLDFRLNIIWFPIFCICRHLD